MLLGIAAEGVSIFRNVMETHTATEVSINATERQDADTKRAKAESCSARLKYMTESTSPRELRTPGGKWEDLKRECDPTYAAQIAACDQSFDAILADLDKVRSEAEGDKIQQRMEDHKKGCGMTSEQRQRLVARSEKYKENAEKGQEIIAVLQITKIQVKADEEQRAGHYDKAFELAQQYLEAAEAWEIKYKGKVGQFTAKALTPVAFFGLFVRKYDAALAAADRSISLDPCSLPPVTNRAHALMFLGRTAEAKTVYLAHRGEKMMQHDWNYYIADDFKQFRAAGVSHPFMNDIERELGIKAADASTPEPKATP